MASLAQGTPRAHAIQEDNSLSEPQKRAMLTSLYQQFRPQFLTILTPAQELQFHALLFDRINKDLARPEGGEPGQK